MTKAQQPTPPTLVHTFNPSILRKYDIRGIYNETLHDLDAYFLGLGLGAYYLQSNLQQKLLNSEYNLHFTNNNLPTACIGIDARHSSKNLKTHLIRGLQDAGINIIDINLGSSPMLYYAVKEINADIGIAITGSHNPSTHNGFKITFNDYAIAGEQILQIVQLIQNGLHISSCKGTLATIDIKPAYTQRILQDLTVKNTLRIGFDCLNGAAGGVIKLICQQINAISFNDSESGDFTITSPDPTDHTNLQNLIHQVKSQNLDLGIAFDGDADRIVIITKTGQILLGDDIMTILVEDVLKNNKGAKIVFDVKCSGVLKHQILKFGGIPLMYKTGHSLIKEKLIKEEAILAGEMSGHIYFADKYYGFDDAIYAAIRLINYIISNNIDLDSFIANLPQTLKSPEIKIKSNKKFQNIDTLKNYCQQHNITYNDIDGIRIEFTDYEWLLIRASNTEEVLIVKYEAPNQIRFTYLQNLLQQYLTLLT